MDSSDTPAGATSGSQAAPAASAGKEDAGPIGLAAYEAFGAGYGEAIQANAYNALFERPSTLSLFSMAELRGKTVLDAGCGPGVYASLMAGAGAKRVVGLDVSPAQLQFAREKYGVTSPALDLREHDLNKPLTDLADGEFDFILSSLTIHYIKDQHAMFKELFRVLRPGGKVVLSTHHPMQDYNFSPTGEYFSTETITQEWPTVAGRLVQVQFFRRPLRDITGAMTEAGFLIECVSEGVLTDELKSKFPEVWEKLVKRSNFIFFRVVKPAR